MVAVSWLFFRSSPRSRRTVYSGELQLVSSALYSVGHGSNDAQKTMGIIWLLLIARRHHHARPPAVLGDVSCYGAIALRHAVRRLANREDHGAEDHQAAAGRRIFRRDGRRSITLFLASSLGVPVSTTHTITGAIIGVGAVQRASAVRWGIAGNIVMAWVITIPASALIAAGAWWVSTFLF